MKGQTQVTRRCCGYLVHHTVPCKNPCMYVHSVAIMSACLVFRLSQSLRRNSWRQSSTGWPTNRNRRWTVTKYVLNAKNYLFVWQRKKSTRRSERSLAAKNLSPLRVGIVCRNKLFELCVHFVHAILLGTKYETSKLDCFYCLSAISYYNVILLKDVHTRGIFK